MKKSSIKQLSLLLVLVMLISMFSACAKKTEQTTTTETTAPTEATTTEDTQLTVGESTDAGDQEQNTERAIKDTLTVGLYEEPGSLDPMAQSLSGNAQVAMNIYDTLFKKTAAGEVLPNLVESYEQVDELTYTLHLREDVYWHNGDKFTADDVVYNLERLTTAPGTKSRYSSLDPENCKAIDEYTVEMKLKSPWGRVTLYLCLPFASMVNPKVAEDPNANMDRNPVGTGPYKFVSWTTGDNITITRNDSYWGDPAVTENVVFKFFTDANIRAVQLETNAIDFYYSVGPTDYDRLMENPDITVVSGTGYGHESIYFSQKCKSVFNDVAVRKAMTYALDIPSIVEAVWGNLASPASSIFSSSVEGYVKVGPVERDVEYAKQILADAGYPDGIDGEIYFPNNSTTQAYMEICQAQWAEAGIRISINSLDSATVKAMNAEGTNPCGRSNSTNSAGDACNALAAWEIGYSGVMQPQDEYIDTRIKQVRASSDHDECMELLKEIQVYALTEQYYAIPVAFPNISYAMSKNVFGFEFNPSELLYLNTMGVYAD